MQSKWQIKTDIRSVFQSLIIKLTRCLDSIILLLSANKHAGFIEIKSTLN